MTADEYLARRKSPDWKFQKIVEDGAFEHVEKVHPLKQRQVRAIVAAARQDPEVRRLILFGSSIRYDCRPDSDLDICVDWFHDCFDPDGVFLPFTRHMFQAITDATRGNADVLPYACLHHSGLKNEIMKGLTIYERHV